MSMTNAEILAAALDGTLPDYDTLEHDTPDETAESETPTEGDEGAPAPATHEAAEPQQEDAPADAEVEGAPILSKSGAYTIPYQKLVDARAERDTLREQVATLQQTVAGLTAQQQANLVAASAQAQVRSDGGNAPTQADANLATATQAMAQGIDMTLFGDFSEADIAKGVAELNRRAYASAVESMRAEVQDVIRREIEPIREREARTATQMHYDAILARHADAYELAESAEFAQWRAAMPAFARAGVEHALTNGSAQEVIEVFDSFRASTQQQKPEQPAPAAQPTRAAPEASARVPNSLSDVPGVAPTDDTQQTLALAGNPGALLERMASMTPEQIDALMNRI